MKIGISLPVREMRDDLDAMRDFAQAAEELGLTHLRVPDQVLRPNSGHLHEPLMLLSYIAAATTKIELVPSVIVLPARQTVLFAKQVATLDRLSGGRVRIGVGVGGSRQEYVSMGNDFHVRGRRCSEQLQALKLLWSGNDVQFTGEFENIVGGSIDPAPLNRHIPIWIGGASVPSRPVIERIAKHAHGWFVLCSPDQFADVKANIDQAAAKASRNPDEIGAEAGVAVVGARQNVWRDRVTRWHEKGLTHLCLRTLGGGLATNEHLPAMRRAMEQLPVANDATTSSA